MARRPLQEINAGSMADIAFLLLIFFLVTTTMNTNNGLQRTLPPFDEKKMEKPPEVKERNVMVVLVNKDNIIAIKGRPIALNKITEKAKEFLSNPQRSENLPEVNYKDIPIIGNYPVSAGIISLQTDRNTSYEKYLQVQNELARAVNELRDEKSREVFGISFEDLEEEKKDAVSKAIPFSISEAEPRKMTQSGG
jgi:biopolymer transport protein ExbD